MEYSVSNGFKIFYGSIALFLAGFSIFLIEMGRGSNVSSAVFALPLSGLIGSVLIIVTQVKRKVIISYESITKIGPFTKRELLFNEVRGCRIGQKVIYIEPSSLSDSKITIGNYSDYADSEEMVAWIKEHFADLDTIELSAEREKLLEDTSLGYTEEDRKRKLKVTKGIAIAYNIIGFTLGFIVIFIDNKYVVAFITLIYPIAGILVIKMSSGLTKFVSNSKRSQYSFVMLGFFLPICIMLFKSLGDYDLFSLEHLWLPFIVSSLIIFGLLVATGINKAISGIPGQIIFMLIMGLIYGYGSSVQINCAFDKSKPEIIKKEVLGQSVQYSKGNHYYLKLSPLVDGQKPKDIEVSRSFYKNHSQGTVISVYFKKGLLNIPWYYVEQ
jgi:hypothetical protein